MNQALAKTESAPAVLEKVVIGGDLKLLSPAERLHFYKSTCESLGLNPITRPFEYITLNGKLTLYARKDATEQLRSIHGISVEKLEREVAEGVYTVTAYMKDKTGRTDTSLGAVSIEGLKGEARANAMMKAETKAKRRCTLSICGLGMLDETEVETIPDARPFMEASEPATTTTSPTDTELSLAKRALVSLMKDPLFTDEQRRASDNWLMKVSSLDLVKKKLRTQQAWLEDARKQAAKPAVDEPEPEYIPAPEESSSEAF